jgi:hypothetical protein
MANNTKPIGVAYADPLLDGAKFVPQVTANTTALTTITSTAPGTADFAVQDLTSTTPFGFASKDEGNTVLAVIANLQTRVAELETKLKTYGILP